ncbi:hypothetical protein GE21DRAFT_1211585 [Neurospora crassa]|nr:hypothetical protein NEUTE2DRAFT_51401 [Neurospora tetrasperma FGSC 2509]KHE83251.1 hypothetical protein GE21DRAFT_1211585 [Neurospora crassa]
MQLPPPTFSRVRPWFKTSVVVGVAEAFFFIPVTSIVQTLYYKATGKFDPSRLTAQEYGRLALHGTS